MSRAGKKSVVAWNRVRSLTSSYGLVVKAAFICLSQISTTAQLRTPENVPIIFYGKVIDQNGRPVEGAKVSLLMVISHLVQLNTEQKSLTIDTDQGGDFMVSGFTAYAIDIVSISKNGYELSKKTELSYNFGLIPTYTPDPNNPVVFRMWKEAGKEALINSVWSGKVACDGTTNRFDLSTGRRSPGGGLEIICSKAPLTVPPPGTAPFNYTFQTTVVGGLIQPTGDEFTFLAPENGYAPSFTIDRRIGDPKWRPRIKQEFYIKTSKGQYGRLSVEWYAWQTPPTILTWDCSINPSGSRNLER